MNKSTPQSTMTIQVIVATCAAIAIWSLPADLSTAAPLPPPATKQINFATDIKPILSTACVKCHSGGKREGGFSIDQPHSFVAGGENGPAVVKGNSAKSRLIGLLVSDDDDVRMPQEAPPLKPEQIALLRVWIDQGMPWEKGFVFGKFPQARLEPREVRLPPVAAPGMENPIDRLLAPYWKKHQTPSSDPASDAVFIRRAYLDVVGLLPTPSEVKAFAADVSPAKRTELIDRLLADNTAYSEHWITFWNDALRNSYTRQYHGGGGARITNWLKQALATNMPYDQFVTELVTSAKGAEGFLQGVRWRGTVNASQVPEMQAAQNVAQVFLGLNLKCASCHDSFINDWKLEQAYAFASVFANGPLTVHRCNKPIDKIAPPAFLFPELGEIDVKEPKNKRLAQLAALMTHKDNGRLSRTMVNRLWAVFFGRGLVEPIDEMDQPPWSADLLDWLAGDFVAHKYDVKHVMRTILTSKAYQRASVAVAAEGDFVFRGPLVRRMSAEQFLDSLKQVAVAEADYAVLGEGSARRQNVLGTRAGLRNLDPLMKVLGRPKRDQVITRRESVATTLQALELTNGESIAATIRQGGKTWTSNKSRSSTELIQAVFHHALGRAATAKELETAEQLVGSPAKPEGVEDLLWILAMRPAFQLIY